MKLKLRLKLNTFFYSFLNTITFLWCFLLLYIFIKQDFRNIFIGDFTKTLFNIFLILPPIGLAISFYRKKMGALILIFTALATSLLLLIISNKGKLDIAMMFGFPTFILGVLHYYIKHSR